VKYRDYQLMSKETRSKIVPKLRFPKFLDDDWKETTLGAIADLIDERAGKNEHVLMSVTSGIGLISQREKFGREIAGSQYKNYYAIKKWDFAYNKSATKLYPEGYIAMLRDMDSAAVPNSVFTCFRITDKKAVPQFLDFLFHDNFHGKWLRKFIEVGARAHGSLSVDIDALFNMPVFLPSSAEQQKIADCLSSLDELITAQSQKLEAIKAHKKALMQQLFPDEGETVPNLRFAEFRDTGEWVSKTLGQCLLQHPDYGINAPAVPYSNNLPTYLRITDISENGFFLKNQMVSVAKDVTDVNYLREGDIVLARTGASVGKSYKYRVEDGELVFAGFLIRVKPDRNNLNSELLFQYFSTEQYWRWVDFTSTRSGQPGINSNEYASMPILLPPSLEEQQKIAHCLSSLDELITTQTKKIEELRKHKKGLMQQLFPNTSYSNKL